MITYKISEGRRFIAIEFTHPDDTPIIRTIAEEVWALAPMTADEVVKTVGLSLDTIKLKGQLISSAFGEDGSSPVT